MRRREFIAGLGSAAVWPLLARAQQGDRVRRIGVLVGLDEDPVSKRFVSAFTQALADLGWTDGRNVRIDLRWGGVDINRIRALAQELIGLQPDIILAGGTLATAALQRETRTIPIVFAGVSDPVVSGIVPRLDRPSGNVTGFAIYEASLGGKWLELLSEIAPGLKRAAIMFNPDTTPVSVYTPSLETAARSLMVVPIIAPVHSDVKSKRPSSPLDARREAALSSCRTHSRPRIARRSYRRRPETTYRRSMDSLTLPETAVCSHTDSTQ
jgi:putative tryptophan/tyrosine transport system substrate-binding protein